jgi:hypothetical protein
MAHMTRRQSDANHGKLRLLAGSRQDSRVLAGYVVTGGSAGDVLKVSRTGLAVMADFGALGFLILEGQLALRTYTLGLGVAGAAAQLDVTDDPVFATMAGDGEIIHSADGSIVHW